MPIPLQKLIDNFLPRNEILFCLRTLYILAVFIQVHQIRGAERCSPDLFFVLLSSLYSCNRFIMPPDPNNCPPFPTASKPRSTLVVLSPFRCWSRSQRAAHTYPKPHSLQLAMLLLPVRASVAKLLFMAMAALASWALATIFGSTTKGALSLIIVFIGDMATSCTALPTLSTAMKIITLAPNSSVLASSPAFSYRSKYFEAGLSVKTRLPAILRTHVIPILSFSYVDMVVQRNRLFVAEPCLYPQSRTFFFLNFIFRLKPAKPCFLCLSPGKENCHWLLARF